MQDEAQQAVRRLRISEGSLPPGLCPLRCGLASGHRGPGRLAHEGSRCTGRWSRSRRRGRRSCAAPRARSQGVHVRDVLDAIATREPGPDRALRRPRDGGRTDAAAGIPRTLRRRIRRGGRRGACRQGRCRACSTPTANSTRGDLARHCAALEAGGPWGQNFPEPLFDGEFEVVDTRIVGERHLKLWLRPRAARAADRSHRLRPLRRARAPRPARGRARAALLPAAVDDLRRHRRAELLAEHLEPCA